MPPQLAVAPDSDQPEPEEQPTHIKFVGIAAAAVTSAPPERGDIQTFTVTGRCVGNGEEERDDGEVRRYRKVKVIDVKFGPIVRRPADDSPQLALDDTLDDD
jgi:hypothetical protein